MGGEVRARCAPCQEATRLTPTILFLKPDVAQDVRVSKELRALAEAGYRIEFIGWDRGGRQDAPPDVPMRLLRFRVGFANWRVAIGYLAWGAYAFWQALVREGDIVHAVDLEAGLPVALASLFRRRPFVYDVFDTFHLRHAFPKPLRAALRACHRFTQARATLIVHVDASRIEAGEERWQRKTIIVMNSPEDIGVAPRRPADRPFTILATGYLRSDRGAGRLLDALDRLPTAHMLAIGLVVEKDLEDRLLRHPRVEFHRSMPQAQALALCQRGDIVTALYDPRIPIYRIASPNKVFDAMMLGLPVLINREVEMSALIEKLDCGYIVPYADTDGLVAALEACADDIQAAEQKGRSGREAYERDYRWDAQVARLLSRYPGGAA